MHAAGDGHVAHAQRRTAAAAGRLDLHRLDAAQADEIGDQRAEVLLPGQFAREHVADVQRVDALDFGVAHAAMQRVKRQVAQALVPVFAHRRLADSDN